MDIITFDKSFQERLTEITNILSSREEILPASRIRSEWVFHTELVLEPVGWQALWKIPHRTCTDLNISHPTIVAVEVENVDFDELTALSKIVMVQDEIHIPEKYDVPLIELYPTVAQENTALDIMNTAECIDQLRFFFTYLWMPWDKDDDEVSDWVVEHLEPRLRLFYDMKRDALNKKTSDLIRRLMKEGREIEARIAELELQFSDGEDDDAPKGLDESSAGELMRLHSRMALLKTEMDVLEDPTMRSLMGNSMCYNSPDGNLKKKTRQSNSVEAYLVWAGGKVEEAMEIMQICYQILPKNIYLKTASCLQEAIDYSNTDDIIVLGKGEHSIHGAGSLEEGGLIKGLGNPDFNILVPKQGECGPSLLEFSGEKVVLEDITIDCKDLQTGIIVRKGSLTLNNCRFICFEKSVTKVGILLGPGVHFNAQNSIFSGLGTGIIVHAGSKVVIAECKFDDCVEGIELKSEAALSASKCIFTNCKEYAICQETKNLTSGFEISDINALSENFPDVTLENCTFNNNINGNVLVKYSEEFIS